MDLGPFGAGEILFIALLALILLGPRRLPAAGRTIGQALTRLRRATNELRHAFEAEVADLEEEQRDIATLGREVRAVGRELKSLSSDLGSVARGALGTDDATAVHGEMRAIGRELREAGRVLERAPAEALPEGSAGELTEESKGASAARERSPRVSDGSEPARADSGAGVRTRGEDVEP